MQYRFDGEDYIPSRDDVRLTGQLLRVWNVVSDEKWRTLREISDLTGDPEPSVSAQLRHLRKERFGSHTVEREYLDQGLYKYRVIVNKEAMRKPIGISIPYRKVDKKDNKKSWVGLTEDEIKECFKITSDQFLTWQIYKRIEDKLKEKNHV